jgi:Ni/Co efflux regulator RcnB
MKKLVLIIAALAVVALTMAADPAFAQSQDDQAACTPDVMRLCQQDIPDRDRIVACLVKSKLQLSPACSGVFNRARTASVPRTKL